MEEVIKINPQEAIKIVEEKVNSISSVLDLKVISTPTFEQAGQAMKIVKESKAFLKEKKDNILNPLNIAIKNIKSLFQPSEERISIIEDYIKIQIGTYSEKLKIEEDKRAQKAEKDISEGKSFEMATKKLEDTQEKIQAIPKRKIQKIRIIDFSKVPDEFKVLDESKAKESFKKGIKVEGLEEYFEEIIINKF
jgi:hypothetical protein